MRNMVRYKFVSIVANKWRVPLIFSVILRKNHCKWLQQYWRRAKSDGNKTLDDSVPKFSSYSVSPKFVKQKSWGKWLKPSVADCFAKNYKCIKMLSSEIEHTFGTDTNVMLLRGNRDVLLIFLLMRKIPFASRPLTPSDLHANLSAQHKW